MVALAGDHPWPGAPGLTHASGCPLPPPSAPVPCPPPHWWPLLAAVLTWMLLLLHPLLHRPSSQSPGLPGSSPPLASPSPPPGCQGPPASRAQLLPAPEGGGHKGALVTTAGTGQPDAWVLLAPSWRGWEEAASLVPPPPSLSTLALGPWAGLLITLEVSGRDTERLVLSV